MKTCIFIFYRDLRIVDNITWNYCCRNFDNIIPIFLYESSEWSSSNQRQFLLECLTDLHKTLKNSLTISTFSQFYSMLLKTTTTISAIASNINYENPDRYHLLKTKITKNITWIEFDDALLVPLHKFNHKPYQKFTPFYEYMENTFTISRPDLTPKLPKFLTQIGKFDSMLIKFKPNEHVYVHGGYTNAQKCLQKFVKTGLVEYEMKRNYFDYDTSYLSAYLSLNVISIREIYQATFKKSQAFIRELFWREFYLHVMHFFPDRISKYNQKPSLNSIQKKKWNDWKNGRTGISLVDACMNQLNLTGYMHNRGRMIVASYLIKNMKIPFQYGEEYFKKVLIDYNMPSNNGGWQWVNGTGVDAQPRYQKFNPDIQMKKYDPNNVYVNTWLNN